MLAMLSATAGFVPAQDNIQAPMHPGAAAAAAAAAASMGHNSSHPTGWQGTPAAAAAQAGEAGRQLACSMPC
jgi:hypothetical protein